MRIGDTEQSLGDWYDSIKKIERKPWHLFFNPNANLVLAYSSLMYQVSYDLNELSEENSSSFNKTASYKLLKNLAQLLSKSKSSHNKYYQFKLTLISFDELSSSKEFKEDILISPVYRSGENE